MAGDVTPFGPWQLEWTPERVRRFWDWTSNNPAFQEAYFSYRYGDAILDEVVRRTRLRSPVLDFGSGPGHLLDKLISRGVETMAADSSPESVSAIVRRHTGNPLFKGAYVTADASIPVNDQSVGTVFLVEVVEHLSDTELPAALEEVRRILLPGGYVVCTTPHDEDLQSGSTICPNCGGVFHTVQHVRHFTHMELSDALQAHGFSQVICKSTVFSPLVWPLRPIHRAAYSLVGRKLPHLLYIGVRT